MKNRVYRRHCEYNNFWINSRKDMKILTQFRVMPFFDDIMQIYETKSKDLKSNVKLED